MEIISFERTPLVTIELPNGHTIKGRPLVVCEEVDVEGGGVITQQFTLHPDVTGKVQMVLFLLDSPSPLILPGNIVI